VSIGSVYRYFPNKHALSAALHEGRLRQVDAIMHKRTTAGEEASLEDLAGSWIEGMVEAHAGDPELSQLLLPTWWTGWDTRLHCSARAASRSETPKRRHARRSSATWVLTLDSRQRCWRYFSGTVA
jgi:AcrR family transcriptional regulator